MTSTRRSRKGTRGRAPAAMLVLLLAGAGRQVRAMEPGRLSLKTPSGLEPGQLALEFEHRFAQGLTAANARIELRYPVWKALELGAEWSYFTYSPRDNAGVSAGMSFHTQPWISVAGQTHVDV